MMELRSLKRSNFREEAVEVLRSAILVGEFEPGSIHSAGSLAERLGVSPTPVREAMLDLVKAGLVEALPNRGFRITTVSEQDLDEICELRMMLEVPALELVVARGAPADLDALEQPLSEIEAAAQIRDLSRFVVADRQFHLGILELTANSRLVRIVGELRDQTRIMGLRALADAGQLENSAAEHRPILDALRSREPDEAKRLMSFHLQHTRGVWAGRVEADAEASSASH